MKLQHYDSPALLSFAARLQAIGRQAEAYHIARIALLQAAGWPVPAAMWEQAEHIRTEFARTGIR